eukprot:690618-Rhodomonas_salina.4
MLLQSKAAIALQRKIAGFTWATSADANTAHMFRRARHCLHIALIVSALLPRASHARCARLPRRLVCKTAPLSTTLACEIRDDFSRIHPVDSELTSAPDVAWRMRQRGKGKVTLQANDSFDLGRML